MAEKPRPYDGKLLLLTSTMIVEITFMYALLC